MDSKALPWQTSSYSMGNGACVEVAGRAPAPTSGT
ncbi:DUF397 domain-containing protein [Streptomyces sp. NPDC014748]